MCLLFQILNVEFNYGMDKDFVYENQFFDVINDGKVYIRKFLINGDGRIVYRFRVFVLDGSWKLKVGKIDCYVIVIYLFVRSRGVGFIQGLYNVFVFENVFF